MIIDRHQLAEIITQEVRHRLTELAEAEGGDGSGKRKRPKKPSTADAEDSPSPKGEPPPGPGGERPDDGTGSDEPEGDPNGSDEVPGDAADASDDADNALDPDGDASEDPTGAVNNAIAGKTIQAITVEPQSKILPGAKEVVITFGESSDALRILITKAGHGEEGPPVKFFYGGQLHDLP